ncbi:MAG: phosphatidate cytidylyltransferase, partial [Actinobacteria bacterium]|nr:phosphatidate cytidylyltransferase [Actinomycetota bacterium]
PGPDDLHQPVEPPLREDAGEADEDEILPSGWTTALGDVDLGEPEQEREPEAGPGEPEPEAPEPDAPEPEAPEPEAPEPEAPEPEGVEPGGPEPEGPGLRFTTDPFAEERAAEEASAREAGEAAALFAEEDAEAEVREGAAELSGEEWDRFRDALDAVTFGDEEAPAPATDSDAYTEATARDDVLEPGGHEEDLASYAAEPEEMPGPGEPEERAPAMEAEEGGITLENLRAMPPVYRDLPGPDEGTGEEIGQPPAGVEAGAFEEEEEEEAPSEEDVAAAADRFAEQVRGRTPDEVEEEILADLDRAEEPPRVVRVGPRQPTFEAGDEVSAETPEEELPRRPDRRGVRVGAADPLAAGPSWQEPSAEDIEHEPAGVARAGRNIPLAFITAVGLVALVAISLWIGAGAFAVVAGIVVLLAQGEFYGALVRARYQPATAIGLLFGALVLAAAYLEGEAAMLSMVALSVMFTFLWYMATPARTRRNALANTAMTVLGVVYVPLLAGYALVILSLPEGRLLMLAVIGLAFVNDIAAFLGGFIWGQGGRPLAPTISPRKTWEGLIIGTVVTIVAGALLPTVDVIGTFGRAFAIAATVAVFAPLGDLAESIIKRDLGIKDMGTILPGHGGVLDRIDSVLLSAPAAFYVMRLLF